MHRNFIPIMEVARVICICVKRSKSLQFALCLAILFSIYAYYTLGCTGIISGLNGISGGTSKASKDKIDNLNEHDVDELSGSLSDVKKPMSMAAAPEQFINVMITFTKAEHNNKLQQKFKTTVHSLFRFASVPVNLYILGDVHSETIAKDILSEVVDSQQYTVSI